MRRIITITAAAVLAVAGILFGCTRGALADSDDPYDSGCVKTAYIANSVGLFDQYGNRLMTIQNWYSRGCRTNWGLAYNYDATYTMVIAYPNPDNNGSLECEPTNCSLGANIPSPMWTDMVPGQNPIMVCGYAIAKSDHLNYGACATA